MSWDSMKNIKSIIGAGIVYSLLSCSAQEIETIQTLKPELPIEVSPVKKKTVDFSSNELSEGINFLRREEWDKARNFFPQAYSHNTSAEDHYFIIWCMNWYNFKTHNNVPYTINQDNPDIIGSRTLLTLQNVQLPSSNDPDSSRLERATILLESLVELYPMNYEHHSNVGNCYALNGELFRASQEYVKALDIWPTDGCNLYTKTVQSYIESGNIHNILEVQTILEHASSEFVMPRLLDKVDEVFWSGVTITHDSSEIMVARGFSKLFDALGKRMLERGETAKAMQYFCMSASNRFAIGDTPTMVKEYIQEKYDETNRLLHGELRPLADVYKNSMKGRIEIPREKELWNMLKE